MTDPHDEIIHEGADGQRNVFRLDEFGTLVHLRSEDGRRFWQYPEKMNPAYLAAINFALQLNQSAAAHTPPAGARRESDP